MHMYTLTELVLTSGLSSLTLVRMASGTLAYTCELDRHRVGKPGVQARAEDPATQHEMTSGYPTDLTGDAAARMRPMFAMHRRRRRERGPFFKDWRRVGVEGRS